MAGVTKWLEPEVLYKGESSGGNMVVKYTTFANNTFYAIGVPIVHWRNPLGPTWSYVVPQNGKVTLVDTGMPGSMELLVQGLNKLDYSISDVGAVVITHGHMDHDGNVAQVAQQSGARIIAHEVYAKLLNADLYRRDQQMGRDGRTISPDMQQFQDSVSSLAEAKKNLKDVHSVVEGDRFGDFTFFYTPGHAADELCILLKDILFTGDHLLPMITPHPTLASMYERAREHLPHGYRHGNKYYGIKVYLQALKKVHQMRKDLMAMPAHRLYFDDKFHIFGVERADEILNHHVERFGKILSLTREKPKLMEDMLPLLFQERHLHGRGWYMAISELQAHLEVLKEAQDIEYVGEGGKLIRATGTQNFLKLIEDLEPYESLIPLPK